MSALLNPKRQSLTNNSTPSTNNTTTNGNTAIEQSTAQPRTGSLRTNPSNRTNTVNNNVRTDNQQNNNDTVNDVSKQNDTVHQPISSTNDITDVAKQQLKQQDEQHTGVNEKQAINQPTNVPQRADTKQDHEERASETTILAATWLPWFCAAVIPLIMYTVSRIFPLYLTLPVMIVLAVMWTFVITQSHHIRGIADELVYNRLPVKLPPILHYVIDSSLEHRHLYPNWLAEPDVSQTRWITDILHFIWPYAKTAIENDIKNMVPPMMKQYQPSFITTLRLDTVDLGPRSPFVVGIKTFDTREDGCMLDLHARAALIPNIKIKVGILTLPIFTIKVTNISFIGCIRAQLKSPVNRWPGFARVQASMTDDTKPTITADITIAGVTINHIPGVDWIITKVMHFILRDILYWPRHIVIDLSTKQEQVQLHGPIGVLQVLVERAENLQKMDTLGSSDPFVVLTIDNETVKTSVKDNTNKPIWNEEFDIPVYNITKQKLLIELFDHDTVGANRPMGNVTIDCMKFLDYTLKPCVDWYNLRDGKGAIRIKALYRPFIANINKALLQNTTDNNMSAMNNKPAIESILFVTVSRIANLYVPGDQNQTRAHIYCNLKMGVQKHKTDTVNCIVADHIVREAKYNQKYTFIVYNTQIEKLQFTVKHHKELTLSLNTLKSTAHLLQGKNITKADTIGTCTVDLTELSKVHSITDSYAVTLVGTGTKNTDTRLYLRMELRDMYVVDSIDTSKQASQLSSRRCSLKDLNSLSVNSSNALPVASIKVSIKSCSDLVAADSNGKSDPFVRLNVNAASAQTKVMYKTLNPTYNDETHILPIYDLFNDSLLVRVFDYDLAGKNDDLGDLILPILNMVPEQYRDSTDLTQIIGHCKPVEDTYPLHHIQHGKITMVTQIIPVQLDQLGKQSSFNKAGSALSRLGTTMFAQKSNTSHDPIQQRQVSQPKKILHITVNEVKNLIAADSNGFSDPFVQLTYCDQTRKTSIKKKCLNAKYDESFTFDIHRLNEVIKVQVYDFDAYSKNDAIGDINIELSDLTDYEQTHDYTLRNVKHGTITLTHKLVDVTPETIVQSQFVQQVQEQKAEQSAQQELLAQQTTKQIDTPDTETHQHGETTLQAANNIAGSQTQIDNAVQSNDAVINALTEKQFEKLKNSSHTVTSGAIGSRLLDTSHDKASTESHPKKRDVLAATANNVVNQMHGVVDKVIPQSDKNDGVTKLETTNNPIKAAAELVQGKSAGVVEVDTTQDQTPIPTTGLPPKTPNKSTGIKTQTSSASTAGTISQPGSAPSTPARRSLSKNEHKHVGTVTVHVISVTFNNDTAKYNPYVKLNINEHKISTKYLSSKVHNPYIYDTKLQVKVDDDSADILNVRVKDHHMIGGGDMIGATSIPVKNIIQQNSNQPQTHNLQSNKGDVIGSIVLQTQYVPL